ncbi:MAG: class I SAM-dependent methyltransferase [Lacisediminihabitans sp.]
MDATGWDNRYRAARESDAARLWSAEPPHDLQQLVSTLAVGRALDLATGDGRNAIWMAGHGWETTAVDFSSEALDLARSRALQTGVTVNWEQGDVTTWSPTGTYDLITMTYLHLGDQAHVDVIRHAGSWLSPGGTLFVIGHDVDNLATGAPGPQDPEILYTPAMLRAAASALQIITAESRARDARKDPEAPGEGAHTAVDTILYAVSPRP